MATKRRPSRHFLPGMAPTLPVDEKAWQGVLEERLVELGYKISHVGRGKTARGKWITPTEPGWPDLFCIRAPFILAIEVKGLHTVVRPTQIEWLETFATLEYARAWILRVNDNWQNIANWIARPQDAPQRHGWNHDAYIAKGL